MIPQRQMAANDHARQQGTTDPAGAPQLEQQLPFTVRIVSSDDDLMKAVNIRHAAYARHVPEFATSLLKPEKADTEDGTVVLLAESKTDGSALGTMRIQTNRFAPLELEESIKLPESLHNLRLAEASRLGVTEERTGRVVKTVLFKAFYQYCMNNAVDWMVITARNPVDRMYERLLFNDVVPDLGYIPLKHVGGIPHRIMSFDVVNAENNWRNVQHPLLDFMCNVHHPDIDIKDRRRLVLSPSAPGFLGSVPAA